MHSHSVLSEATMKSGYWRSFSFKGNSSKTVLYSVLDYNYLLFPVTLATTFYALYELIRVTGYYKILVSDHDEWNLTTVVYALFNLLSIVAQYPPYAGVWGLCLPMRPFAYAQAPRQRSFRTLRICLVTKGTNFQTVMHSIRPWASLQNRSRLHFHVVLDDDKSGSIRQALPSFIEISEVPISFVTKQAKHKARALEYFRQQQHLTEDDWVLHLDEESVVDKGVINACLDFIERGKEDIGMGTILYNSANHWKNAFLSVAEVTRIAEDFGRFQLPVLLWRRPLLGWMHGSWILLNGAVENKVTWDTDCAAEDFWFAYQAGSLGYKFGWLHAIIREQPPETLRDFFRQRRRWYTGILSIYSVIVRLVLITSVGSALGIFISPIYGLLGMKVLIPRWLYLWSLWTFATNSHVLLVSSVIQDMDTMDVSWISLVGNAVTSVLLAPVVHFAQAAALVSCIATPAKGFHVISKS